MATKKIESNDAAWDDRKLGADEGHVAVAGGEHLSALDDALELQMISIRLPKQMIDQYKLIGHFHGVGYQPLMRDILARFVPEALREILDSEQKKAAKSKAELAPLRKVA